MITEKIKKIFFLIRKDINEKMRPYNLTAAQILLLKYLDMNDGKVLIQKDICNYLSLKHSTVIGILKRLEAKELIIKKTNHKSEITITEKGKKIIRSAGVKKGFVEDNLLKGFSKEEKEQLDDYLDRIYSNINN